MRNFKNFLIKNIGKKLNSIQLRLTGPNNSIVLIVEVDCHNFYHSVLSQHEYLKIFAIVFLKGETVYVAAFTVCFIVLLTPLVILYNDASSAVAVCCCQVLLMRITKPDRTNNISPVSIFQYQRGIYLIKVFTIQYGSMVKMCILYFRCMQVCMRVSECVRVRALVSVHSSIQHT